MTAAAFALRHPLLTLGRSYTRRFPGGPGAGLIGGLSSGGLTGMRGLRRSAYRGWTTTSAGDHYFVDTVAFVEQYLYLFGVWEPALQRWLQGRLSDGDVLIDIGANVGAVSIPGARLVGAGGSVVAVEAIPSTAGRLRRNIERNSLTNIRVVEAAVSDEKGDLELHVPTEYNRGATSVIDSEGSVEAFTVPAAPLGDLLTADEIARTRVVKIDVEGAEPEVLSGLLPLLPDMPADVEIQVEVSPGRIGVRGHTVKDIFSPLESLGFHAYRLDNEYSPFLYPPQVHDPRLPQRIHHPVQEDCDVVFSRIDSETLVPRVPIHSD